MRRSTLGRYHHRSGSWRRPRPQRTRRPRRKFPFFGLVPAVFAVVGPLLCASAALFFQAIGQGRLLVELGEGAPLPPAPSLDNVLFGAGLPETVFASALFGAALWAWLWRPTEVVWRADQIVGAGLGGALALACSVIGLVGLFVRTGPAGNVPIWHLPTLFALSLAVGYVGLLARWWVMGSLLVIGAVAGALTSVVVDIIKPRMPIIER